MFKKQFVLVLFLATVANTGVFAQAANKALNIDTAIAGAADEIAQNVPRGSQIAVLNITSDFEILSNHIISELIAKLVAKRSFQVLERSKIALEIAQTEFDFQYSGFVSDDTQINIGQFLGAETIVTGSVTIDTSDNYHLTINAIHLENFAFQAIYGAYILNDRQLVGLTADKKHAAAMRREPTMQRLGTGVRNIFFGAGSLSQGQTGGGLVLMTDLVGVLMVGVALIYKVSFVKPASSEYYYEKDYKKAKEEYDSAMKNGNGVITAGAVTFGAGIVIGFVVPFLYEPGSNRARTSQGNFPFDLQLVSSDNRNIDGFRVSYRVSY